MGKESAKAAKAAAEAARAQANAQERSRERKVRLIGGLVVLVIMGGLLAIPIINGKNKGPATNTAAALPKGVTKDTYGVKIGPAWTAANADSIPTLQLWEDFQCPACGDMEKRSGAKILELADAGKLRLEWRPTIFLDSNLQAQNTANNKPNSSLRATVAFGCAVDQDAAEKFHSALFAAQPAEGKGYNNSDLTVVAQSAGLTGEKLTKFMECITNKTYEGWANNSFDQYSKQGIAGTPSGILNGTELQSGVLFDPAKLEQAIADATKK